MQQSLFLRQNHGVTRILTLALALGLGFTSAASATPPNQAPAWAEHLDIAQAPAPIVQAFSELFAASAQPQQVMAGTITVTSCANSGNGSLRSAVAAATSGDTIDLSHLTCSPINLTGGQITVAQATLTIKGTPGTSVLNPPKPKIDAMQAGRVFNHTGTGSLILKDMYLTHGYIDFAITGQSNSDGGCVYSNGNVSLSGTYVAFCEAHSGGRAAGGAIYAKGNISLGAANVVVGNTVSGAWYGWGGALYSGATVSSSGGSTVNTNTATVEGNGYARGGGIYAVNGIIGSGLSLQYNTAQSTGTTAQSVEGGGAYVGSIWINGMTASSNHAIGSSSKGGGLYVHKTALISGSTFNKNDAGNQGGGVYTEDTATIKTSTISNNTSQSGGGIYALTKLTLATSSVSDNSAGNSGGGVYAYDGLSLTDSNIIANHADTTRGGISAYGNISIQGSTIANNTSAHVAGAGLGNSTTTNPITISHSTIYGNSASDSNWGAGLYLLHDTVVRNSTIAGNFARNTSNSRYGAGISLGDSVQLTLSSAIVSGNGLKWGNSPMNLPMPDDIGKASGSSVVYNIIGSHNMIGYSSVTTPADTIGQSNYSYLLGATGLNPLADNGGPTLTALPGPTSLALDNGTDNNYDCDQRHDGYGRIVGFAADIGAVEVQANENPDRIFASGFETVSTSCN